MMKINRRKVGKLIARGGDFVVRKYGENEVIKYSKLSLFLGRRHREKMINDYKLCKKYFREFVVDVEVVDKKSGKYIEIQNLIIGEKLIKEHLKSREIFAQLLQIQKIMEEMEKAGLAPIDLIGIDGVFKECFGNIIVDKHNKLRIIDATLQETKNMGLAGIIFSPFMILAKNIQRRRLKKFSHQKE